MRSKVTYLWKEPNAPECYRTAVSLHGHTNHSKEGLYFIPEFAARHWPLRAAVASQEKRAWELSSIRVDFSKAYWTPPLRPLTAFRLERDQIEKELGLKSMVSLSDHDNIEAAMLLRVLPEAQGIPVSVEWSVPFRDTILHLGVHNLPSAKAESIMADFAGYTARPNEDRLPELFTGLHDDSGILVVLNHPMWDLAGIGTERHAHTVSGFLADLGMYIHAFELGGLRSWEENQAVLELAEGWNQIVIAGGDRHGCEPSAVLNLTTAESFTEFVEEVRTQRRSHVLFMLQYAEPHRMRLMQSLLDVVREYPDLPEGSQRWDERTFHPDSAGIMRPLSSLWDKPPAFIEAVFAGLRLMEFTPVKRAIQRAFGRPEHQLQFSLASGQEVAP